MQDKISRGECELVTDYHVLQLPSQEIVHLKIVSV